MKILPFKQHRVAKNMSIWITNHYTPNLFGIRGNYESSYKSGQYVEMFAPGTGFFVRNGSSHAYKTFCNMERAKLKTTYWDMVLGREFSFDKQIDEINAAQRQLLAEHGKDIDKDPEIAAKARILESISNVMPNAQEAELHERELRGIRDLSHRRGRLSSYQSHVMTNIKSRIARLGHDVRGLQLMVANMCGQEKYEAFGKVVVAFSEMAQSHRIWHARENFSELENSLEQVFFDLGIFNFIQAPLMTPLMRDSYGNYIFLYPDNMIVARSATDFDVYDLRKIHFVYHETQYEMISSQVLGSYETYDHETKTHRHGRNYEDFGSGLLVSKDTVTHIEDDKADKRRDRVVGQISINELKMRFYIYDAKSTYKFCQALEEYIQQLVNNPEWTPFLEAINRPGNFTSR